MKDITKVTNEQLGAVYLKIKGLDRERFLKLTEGMNWSNNYTKEEILNTLGFKYLENFDRDGYMRWIGSDVPENEAKLINLDELEEILFPKTQNTKFTVTRKALAEILPHVCDIYGSKIKNIAQKDLFSNDVEVPEDIVRLAHKDATNIVQRDWLNKYLPLPKKKKIELVKYLNSNGDSSVGWDIGVDPDYKIELILPKEVSSLKYDVMKVKLQGDKWDIFLGHWNEGVTED